MNLVKWFCVYLQQTWVRNCNTTSLEAMRVSKYEQVFTNITIKKITISQELFPLIFPTLSFSSPFFPFLSPPLSSSFLPHLSPPIYLSSHTHTPLPHLPLLNLLSSLFFDLVARDVQLNVDVKFPQVLAS